MFTAPLSQLLNSNSKFSAQESAYYGGLFNTLDTDEGGSLNRDKLTELLRSSQLPDGVLYQIWSQVDFADKGRFNLEQFSKICRLVGHAQQGVSQISPELMGVEPSKFPVFFGSVPGTTKGAETVVLSFEEQSEFNNLFEKLRQGSIIPPEAVKNLFLKSGLAQTQLAKIFDLSTAETGGVMGYGEFLVAMHLVSKCRVGSSVPTALSEDIKRLLHTPTPETRAKTSAQTRAAQYQDKEEANRVAATELAFTRVRDTEYYKKYDEMKRLETQVAVAKASTGSWQDQILICQGRLGEIENELEDLSTPNGSTNVTNELFEDMEHDLQNSQTKLDKLNRTKTDLRMQVQVLRENLQQRSRDSDLLNSAVSADMAKLGDLRRQRLALVDVISSRPTNPVAATPVLDSSMSLRSGTVSQLRRDSKGVKVLTQPSNQRETVFTSEALNQTSNPSGWETFGVGASFDEAPPSQVTPSPSIFALPTLRKL